MGDIQAPAGTGKTFIISIYVTKSLENDKGVILISLPTYLAVQEIAEKVLISSQLTNGNLVFLQSSNN